MEKAAKDEVVATFALLAVGADLDAVELAELRQLAKKLSGAGLRVIDNALKAAQQKQAAQNAKSRACATTPPAGRTRGRMIRSPFPDEPWLPQMDVLNEVIGGVISAKPPSRDIDGDAMWVRKLPVPNMHAFTDANQEGDDE